MQQCQVGWNIPYIFLLQAIDSNHWCMKNGLLSGGLNPRPFSHESSALTTRAQLWLVLLEVYMDCVLQTCEFGSTLSFL